VRKILYVIDLSDHDTMHIGEATASVSACRLAWSYAVQAAEACCRPVV